MSKSKLRLILAKYWNKVKLVISKALFKISMWFGERKHARLKKRFEAGDREPFLRTKAKAEKNPPLYARLMQSVAKTESEISDLSAQLAKVK